MIYCPKCDRHMPTYQKSRYDKDKKMRVTETFCANCDYRVPEMTYYSYPKRRRDVRTQDKTTKRDQD